MSYKTCKYILSILIELHGCSGDDIMWEARKSKRGQDIRVGNPRLPDLGMFWGPWREYFILLLE